MRGTHAWGAVSEAAAALADATVRWRSGDAISVRRLRRLAAALAPEIEEVEEEEGEEEGGEVGGSDRDVRMEEERGGGEEEERGGGEEESGDELIEGADVGAGMGKEEKEGGEDDAGSSGGSESSSMSGGSGQSDVEGERAGSRSVKGSRMGGSPAVSSDDATTHSTAGSDTSDEQEEEVEEEKGKAGSDTDMDSQGDGSKGGLEGGASKNNIPGTGAAASSMDGPEGGDDADSGSEGDKPAGARDTEAEAEGSLNAAALQQPALPEVCVVHNPRAAHAAAAMLGALLRCPTFLSVASGRHTALRTSHSSQARPFGAGFGDGVGVDSGGGVAIAALTKDPCCPGAPPLPPHIQQMPLPLTSLTHIVALYPPSPASAPTPVPPHTAPAAYAAGSAATGSAATVSAHTLPAAAGLSGSDDVCLDLKLEHLVLLETLLGLRRSYTAAGVH